MTGVVDEAFVARPGPAGVALTAVATLLAVGAVLAALPVGGPGRLALAGLGLALAGGLVGLAGVTLGRRRVHAWGTVGLAGAVLATGASGARPVPLVVATVLALVAWDAGANAIDVGVHLGRDAASARGQVVHALATTAVAGLVGALVVGVYRTARGATPGPAVAVLLLGVVVLAWALERRH